MLKLPAFNKKRPCPLDLREQRDVEVYYSSPLLAKPMSLKGPLQMSASGKERHHCFDQTAALPSSSPTPSLWALMAGIEGHVRAEGTSLFVVPPLLCPGVALPLPLISTIWGRHLPDQTSVQLPDRERERQCHLASSKPSLHSRQVITMITKHSGT